jgi:molybdate transport system substrate-binding protein
MLLRLLPPLAAAALVLGGCDAEEAGSPETSDSRIVVFAASSLQPAFEAYAEDFAEAEIEFSFAGSDTLAAQIRQGVEPDVYAAANTAYPDELHGEGLLEDPVVFATNRLVLAVPTGSAIESIEGAGAEGVTVAVGAEGVPVGDYTREVLDALPGDAGERILGNVASEEPDVAGVIGKLTQGAVDAGFVYVTDVAAAGEGVRAIELPAAVSPDVAYGVAVGSGASEPEAAARFVDGLLAGAGADALAAHDFGRPPAEGGGY